MTRKDGHLCFGMATSETVINARNLRNIDELTQFCWEAWTESDRQLQQIFWRRLLLLNEVLPIFKFKVPQHLPAWTVNNLRHLEYNC